MLGGEREEGLEAQRQRGFKGFVWAVELKLHPGGKEKHRRA